MSTAAADALHPVLLDRFATTWVRTVIVVLGAAALTTVAAHIRVPLPFTPVPIVGTTLVVLLTGAALGPLRAMSAQLVYISFGLVGLPWFAGGADGGTGPAVVFGATGGYLFGFILAAVLVGMCARRGWDRSLAGMGSAFALGTATIYLFGAPWLAVMADLSATEALTLGVVPFLVGDAAKAAVAGMLLPATWRLLEKLNAT